MLRRYCIALMTLTSLLVALPTASVGQTTGVEPKKIVILGDSLSAEYGLKRGTGWVSLLSQRLQNVQKNGQFLSRWTVVNASISGDTTSGARARLASLLAVHRPTVLVIELGGNDALRGLTIAQTQNNLAEIVRMAHNKGARVVLLGMQMPPNYGKTYATAFANIYPQLAKQYQMALVPFFLANVADAPNSEALFLSDRIHPNELAQSQLMENVWPTLFKLITTKAAP